ncbi:MAG: DUF6056 family protein [Erysipelotrichaceae bacterium]|nr:DUF6056 family protein [Erysipelotrichaceae bacterium]
MGTKILKKQNLYKLIVLFVFIVFCYITIKTPLAGDDWGYALNGSQGSPILMTIEFYKGWSGRFFSELWGMLIPKNKILWNIINPLLFTGIYVFLYKLTDVKKKPVLNALLILAFILSVDDNLRMETYTWIMGTTYIIPLLFSLVYFYIAERIVVTKEYDKNIKIFSYLSNVLLFIIGLMMENIAAVMIGSIAILIIYCFFNNKNALKYLVINLFFSSISFLIMRMSPGSAYRLMNDNAVWANLSVIEKIVGAYPNFLQMTFINNNYAIALFSIVLIGLAINKKNKYKYVSVIVSMFGIFTVFSFVLGSNMFNDCSSIYSMIFWPLYVINAFASIFLFIEDTYQRDKTIFLLIVAGAAAVVMLMSPIYGSRSAIYTVYYLIAVSVVILENIDIDYKYVSIVFLLILLFIIGDRTVEYINKYHLVGLRNNERMEVIKYYQEHPEDEEVWIPRFPVYSIHGADIEPGDTYHFETFKEYYGLPQDADKIHFYFVEDNY